MAQLLLPLRFSSSDALSSPAAHFDATAPLRQATTGAPSPWTGESIALNSAIDFSALLRGSIAREDGAESEAGPTFTDSTLTDLSDSDSEPSQPPSATSSASLALPANSSKKRQRKDLERLKKRGHNNRKRKRANKEDVFDRAPPSAVSFKPTKHTASAVPLPTNLQSRRLPVTQKAYVGAQLKGSRQTYGLKQLVGPDSQLKFERVTWDGKKATPIADADGRVAAVLVGQPDDSSWESICREAAAALERSRCRCSFPAEARMHRRGHFPALAIGVSYGGGRQQPGNVALYGNAKELNGLVAHPSFRRIAGFASGAFAAWSPRLYKYYADHMHALFKQDDDLVHIFPHSVWTTATFNFGPQTICFDHTDAANLPFGWCAITALGAFDPTKGGHLILWDCKLVIEFPPGSTILIPSAVLRHSNARIRKSERRYSFTQYCPGALFRWVDHKFMKDEDFYRTASPEELHADCVQCEARWEMGLGLFSTLDEIRTS